MKLNSGKLFSYYINAHKPFPQCRNDSKNLLQGSGAIADTDTLQFLNSLDLKLQYNNYSILQEFTSTCYKWLNSGSIKIIGLENYDVDYSNGTTQSFDSFYFRHHNRRFRCLVGEYFYHLKSWICGNINWQWITSDQPLQRGDALVLSIPFCDTGNMFDYHELLEQCNQLNIPVLLDCCYISLTQNTTIDCNYNCIDTISYSLSKTFPVAHYRIGIRFTKPQIFDGQKLHHSINYNNILGAAIGNEFIKKFTVDYIHKKYYDKQKIACEFFNLEPSDSILFATGDESWSHYSRQTLLDAYKLEFEPTMFANRICLRAVYENWNKFLEFKNEY